jgi:hypothetical protein
MRRRLAAVPVLGAAAALAMAGVAGAVSDRGSDPLFTALDGGYEVSPEGKVGVGDPNGFGSATVIFRGARTVCYGLTVANLDKPVAAHIHRGAPGENGPVVIPLMTPSAGAAGTSSGCVRVNAKLAKDIREHPKHYYVNVHTEALPAGAVRGNLH